MQGKVVLLQLNTQYVVVDRQFLKELMATMEKISTMELSGDSVMAIGSSCHVWRRSNFQDTFEVLIPKDKMVR